MRVRFAPSPSGQLHVGNARTALFNWLLARHAAGTFLVRIEDTDAARSTAASDRSVIEDLRWLGLAWDEGVEAGGEAGPYRQSERLHVYRAHAVELLAGGHAYRCFCTTAQLEADREQALREGRPPMYAGRCRHLPAAESRRRVQAGEPSVVRLRVPESRDVGWDDLVRGHVHFSTDVIGDPVLLRPDGMPAYNYAVVIDDALMAITHVVRGEDHISNTPRQLLLYEAFGWTPPRFGHVSMVLGPDHVKLSKRHGATSVAEFRAKGYLPEALVNYLALLGWSPGAGEELLSLDEMARRFRVEDVGLSAGVFDEEKLAWVNRHYLKGADPVRLADLVVPFLASRGWAGTPSSETMTYLAHVVPGTVASVDRLEQVPSRLAFLFDYQPARTLADDAVRGEAAGARDLVHALATELAGTPPMRDRDAFRAMAARLRERTGRKGRELFHPMRLVLTGEPEGMELDLAVPAIEAGAALAAPSGLAPIPGAAARAHAFAEALG
ncbi:MAG: glutamate--tRNA ligase [Vicinamibacterales bacterium]